MKIEFTEEEVANIMIEHIKSRMPTVSSGRVVTAKDYYGGYRVDISDPKPEEADEPEEQEAA